MGRDRWARFTCQEQIAETALQVRCPRCGRDAGIDCYSWTEQLRVSPHPSRVAAALAAGL